MANNWFISDTHFGHTNVIRYSNRPYRDAEEMDASIIANWNSKVQPGDNIYHLGDVFFCSEERAHRILDQLNGVIHLIYGNHDKLIKRSESLRKRFAKISDYRELTIDGQSLVLCHYPMITWNKSHHGSWMLHGHSHGSCKYPFEAKIHDAGVDQNGYFPISFDDVRRIMSKKKFSAVDHHGD